MYPFIKYEIQKHVEHDSSWGDLVPIGFFNTKYVSKRQFRELEKEGWFFVRKRYLLITAFIDWYIKQSDTIKIGLPGLVMGFIYFIVPFLSNSLSSTGDKIKNDQEKILIDRTSESGNSNFIERTLSFYNPNKSFWLAKDRKSYEHLRRPENLKMLHETFKKIGYDNLISDYELTANPCMIWSYINRPCNELADSLLITYELDSIESKYYREFWERRKLEGNSQTVYEILQEISAELYEGHSIEPTANLVNDTLYQLLTITQLSDTITNSQAIQRFEYLRKIGLHESAYNLLFERYRYSDVEWNREQLKEQLSKDTTKTYPWPWVEDDTK
jgi:hypothetical protein